MSDNLYENYPTNDDGSVSVYGSLQISCQTFTPTLAHTITSVKVKLCRGGNVSPGDITVSIRNVSSGTGKPTGSNLCSGTTNGNTLPMTFGTAEFREITFVTPVALSASTLYAICVVGLTSDSSNMWAMCRDGSSPTYTNGQRGISADGGTTWTMASSDDFLFYEYGLPTGTLPSSDSYTTKQLVCCASNEVWYESVSGTMSQLVASIGQLDTSDLIDMFELYGKAFIVNNDLKKVVDFANIKLTIDALTTAPTKDSVITQLTGGATMVVDYVSADKTLIYGRVLSGTFVTTAGYTLSGGSMDPTDHVPTAVTSPPHFYDWTIYAGVTATYGTLPTNTTIGCNYMGRAVLSGFGKYPHQWYMSRQGNPWNWLYGVNDKQSAIAGNDAEEGEVGDVIRALIPIKDDYLIFGCESTIWYCIGNPCDGGSIEPFAKETGIYGPKAWCFDGSENLYFWGRNGLYKTKVPGQPVCISEVKLPNLINDEAPNPSTHRIVLSFDGTKNGIIISITKLSDGTNSNYWYDLRALDKNEIGGFFPEVYPEECSIYSSFYYESKNPTYRKLILGCKNGYLQFFDPTAEDDDIGSNEEVIDSYVDFGPIQMSDDPKFLGKLTSLICEGAGGATDGSQSDSNNIYYKIFIAKSAEEIIEKLYANSVPIISGTFISPGRQHGGNMRKKISNVYMGIKLGNNTVAQTWAMEQLLYEVKRTGRLK